MGTLRGSKTTCAVGCRDENLRVGSNPDAASCTRVADLASCTRVADFLGLRHPHPAVATDSIVGLEEVRITAFNLVDEKVLVPAAPFRSMIGFEDTFRVKRVNLKKEAFKCTRFDNLLTCSIRGLRLKLEKVQVPRLDFIVSTTKIRCCVLSMDDVEKQNENQERVALE